MAYNWQLPDWPDFRYDLSELETSFLQLAEGQGQINGLLSALPANLRKQSEIDIMVAEAIKTSAIEGELLSREEVLSSIRNQLGLNRSPEKIKDKRVKGITRLMLAVREDFADDLTEERLYQWHWMMMESFANLNIGQWRSGEAPMQIISGAIGREIVHFEAPPSEQLGQEMDRFIVWFNETAPGQPGEIPHGAVRSAVAHLYFESIHPFEDGNGRIGRALSEKALSQAFGKPVLLSLSNAIEAKRQDYYGALKSAQRSNEITPWIHYFIKTILEAQQLVVRQVSFVISKTHFFDRFAERLNSRQEKVINRVFEEGPDGFEGGLSAKKYMAIAKTTKATATRDLQNLTELGALRVIGGGRSTRYELNQ